MCLDENDCGEFREGIDSGNSALCGSTFGGVSQSTRSPEGYEGECDGDGEVNGDSSRELDVEFVQVAGLPDLGNDSVTVSVEFCNLSDTFVL